ncbi:MAG TPA: hypothetical protein VIM73_10965 [Polyangiaceae bacterium]
MQKYEPLIPAPRILTTPNPWARLSTWIAEGRKGLSVIGGAR